MTTITTTSALVPGYLDVTRLAVASFLARYREPTLTAYTEDLKAYLGWCQTYERDVLRVTRGELETYVRYLESRGYAAATVARRFGTVATFYKYAVIDGGHAGQPSDGRDRAQGGLGGTEAHSAPALSSPPCWPRPEPRGRTTKPARHPAARSRAAGGPGRPSTVAPPARSCGPGPGGGWTEPEPPGH